MFSHCPIPLFRRPVYSRCPSWRCLSRAQRVPLADGQQAGRRPASGRASRCFALDGQQDRLTRWKHPSVKAVH